MRTAFSDLDLSLARLDAFLRLASHLQDSAERELLQEGEGFLTEAMIAESQKARRAFNRAWAILSKEQQQDPPAAKKA